jgi:hypothetical protein
MMPAVPKVVVVLELCRSGLHEVTQAVTPLLMAFPFLFWLLRVALVIDLEEVKVLVLRAHHDLDHIVQPVEGDFAGNAEPTPDRWLRVQKRDL